MKKAPLFERVVAYKDKVFRNIVKLSNDFSDISDDKQCEQAIDLVLKYVSQQQTAEQERNVYASAIAFPFEQMNYAITRYSDGSYPVWYGSTLSKTTLYETAYHMVQDELSVMLEMRPATIIRYRDIYTVQCDAILIDFTGKQEDFPQLITDDYGYCQRVGLSLHQQGHPGLLSPSARCKGVNVNIFNPSVLSQPKKVDSCRYELDLEKQSINVTFENKKSIQSANITIR